MFTNAITVIVPNFNHGRYLKQRIDSILNQTFQDFEIIILDDHSTDDSVVIIESYRNHPKISEIIYNEKNSGSPFAQWTKGINLAKSKYLWIAESDDFSDPLFLEKMIGLISSDQRIGIAYCNSNWVDAYGVAGPSLSLFNESYQRSGREELVTLLDHNTVQNVSSALILTEHAKKATFNLDKYKACGDWLFYIRILQISDIAYTPSLLNNFRWYHSNTSHNAQKEGRWIVEGIDIISQINPGIIQISAGHYRAILALWYVKVKNASMITSLTKAKCYVKLLLILSKVVITRGI
ncbi:glycosyltransferase family A protein [Flavitalea sp.]|nr:glycosyltransferase family A protein [Flavitalea sp.]